MDFYLQQFILPEDGSGAAAFAAASPGTFGDAHSPTRLFSATLDAPLGLGYWVVQARRRLSPTRACAPPARSLANPAAS